jgi:hypothetical protein
LIRKAFRCDLARLVGVLALAPFLAPFVAPSLAPWLSTPAFAASEVPPDIYKWPIGKIDAAIQCQPNQGLAADQPEEPGCLAQFGDSVTRQGDDLSFKLDNGKTKLIKSNPKACDGAPVDGCVIYQLVGYLRQSRQFVLRVSYYESEFVHLVSQRTGAVTELEGYPHPSPSGRHFVTVAASDAWEIESPIAIYANVEPPKLEWRFPEPVEYEQYAFGGWDGEDRVKLRTISNPAIETDLKRTERTWILRRPNGKESSGTSLPPPPPHLSPEAALSKEAAEAWSAVRQSRNPVVLLEFIKRYRTTSLVEPAQARLKEIASPWPAVTAPPPPMAISDSTPATGGKDGPPQGAAAKSEAAEAWDAIKDTTNPALLEAFITRYATTFFAEIAKARLDELKSKTAKPSPPASAQPFPDVAPKPVQTLTMPPTPEPPPADGIHQRSVLYEEEPGNSTGRQFAGTVVWRSETIKAEGRPDDLAIRADVEIQSRSLRMTMTLRRNLDPSLPATHIIELTSHFDNGGIENIPGMLMKSNERARGLPFAGLSVKVTDGSFMLGLSNATAADRERNLNMLVERAWFDIPMNYTNRRRAILAIEKGETGDRVFETVLKAWGQYPAAAGPAASVPARDR